MRRKSIFSKASIENSECSLDIISAVTAILTRNDYSWMTAKLLSGTEHAIFFWSNAEMNAHPLVCSYSPEKPQLHFSSLAWSCDLEPKPVLMYTTVMEKQIIAEKTVLETIKAVNEKMQTCDSVCFCNHLSDLDRYIKDNGYSIIERRIRVHGFGKK